MLFLCCYWGNTFSGYGLWSTFFTRFKAIRVAGAFLEGLVILLNLCELDGQKKKPHSLECGSKWSVSDHTTLPLSYQVFNNLRR